MAYMGIAVFRKKLQSQDVEIIEVENLNELDEIRSKMKE